MNPNQHYIPKSLLKNFLTTPQKDQVYWYQKEGTYPNPTKTVFSEGYYYGRKGSEYFADGVISDGEQKIVDILLPKLLMMEGLLNEQDSKQVCDFIAHFALRRSLNRNLLSTIAEEYCIEDDDLSLDKFLNSFKPISLKMPSSIMLRHNYFLRIYLALFQMNSHVNFLKGILEIHAENSRNDLKSQSIDAHNKIIIAKNNHQLVAESLSDFRWAVLQSQPCLILGDTVCFFESQDNEFSPFDNGLIKNIYMPISSQKLLVGFKESYPPKVNFDQINHQNARCCYHSFIYSEKSDKIQTLVNLIGENFKPVQQKVFEDVNSSIDQSIFSQFSAHFVENPDDKQMLDYLRDRMGVTKQKSSAFNKIDIAISFIEINLAIWRKFFLRFRR